MAAAFDLTQNPFHLLGASVRARREEVVEAREEALVDGRADEVVLTRAQQAILTPRTRTEAELSWLPGLSPSQAREILSKVEGSHLAHTDQALDGLRGLDRANLAADLCARSAGETKYVGELLEAYGEFSAGDVLETLTGLRSVSGFPIPDQQHVQNALAALKVTHAKAAVACISAAGSPGQALTEIVEAFLDWGDEDVDHLLGLIVREYDAWSEPRLNAIKEKIAAGIAAHRDGDGPIPVNQLVGLLAEWDEISQPVQLLEESKGHEEPRSKEIYETVRDFCLWLANENGRYEQALAIARALLETFPELPAVAAQLSQDVDALESLASQAKSIKLMGPLIRAQEAAQEDISAFDADLVVSGFGPESRGLAKKLYDAFAEVAAKTVGTELADMPWMVVRGLAIDLNNEHDSSEGACALLEGLLHHNATVPSRAVVDKLTADKRTLRRNLKWEELKGSSADVAKGISLVTELLDGADADERAALLQLKAALSRKRAAATRKRVFWGLAAAAFVGFLIYDANKLLFWALAATAFVGFLIYNANKRVFWGLAAAAFVGSAAFAAFLIYDANKKPSYSPRPSPTTAFTPSTPRASSPPSSTLPSETEEQIPPRGTDRVLNRSEVRYCIFQGERLTILRALVSSDPEIDRFNGLVNDFNARCSSFRYRQGVLQAIEAEVPGQRQSLRLEVQRLLSSWRASQSLPPASSANESLIDIASVSGAMLVQKKLKELGYYGGAVDGIWGQASQTALRSFKLSQSGLGYDDSWDLMTQRALMGR